MITVLLILLGALPYLFGGLLYWYMTIHPEMGWVFPAAAAFTLAVWAVLSFIAFRFTNRISKVVIPLNFIPFVDLVLVAVQVLILKSFWPNVIGTYTSLFYLPVMDAGFALTHWTNSMFWAYVASFILLVVASFAGCELKKQLLRHRM